MFPEKNMTPLDRGLITFIREWYRQLDKGQCVQLSIGTDGGSKLRLAHSIANAYPKTSFLFVTKGEGKTFSSSDKKRKCLYPGNFKIKKKVDIIVALGQPSDFSEEKLGTLKNKSRGILFLH